MDSARPDATAVAAQGGLGTPQLAREFGVAWVVLGVALVIHVGDEAATDFLSVYNPTVMAIRARFSFLPLPTFTFGMWLTGLCLGILLLLSLSPLAFRGRRSVVWLACPLGGLMFANGLGHVGGSWYVEHLLPGVYSSPMLLLASACLLAAARRELRRRCVSSKAKASEERPRAERWML